MVLALVLSMAVFTSTTRATPTNPLTNSNDMPTCTVKVHTITEVEGKCVRLRGGTLACQSDGYLDPLNEDCSALR